MGFIMIRGEVVHISRNGTVEGEFKNGVFIPGTYGNERLKLTLVTKEEIDARRPSAYKYLLP